MQSRKSRIHWICREVRMPFEIEKEEAEKAIRGEERWMSEIFLRLNSLARNHTWAANEYHRGGRRTQQPNEEKTTLKISRDQEKESDFEDNSGIHAKCIKIINIFGVDNSSGAHEGNTNRFWPILIVASPSTRAIRVASMFGHKWQRDRETQRERERERKITRDRRNNSVNTSVLQISIKPIRIIFMCKNKLVSVRHHGSIYGCSYCIYVI